MFDINYRVGKLRERILIKIAWALPKSVAMWAAIRVGAHATTGKWENQVAPELGFVEALDRWDK